jgi:integration host factor subunit beta
MKITITKRDIAKRVARQIDEKLPLTEKVASALFTILREVMAEADPEVRIEIRDSVFWK